MLRALAPLGVRVLVIDDNSPDGTGEIADRLAAELDFVSVLHRQRKEGLGPAYLAGFRRALADGAELRARDGLRLLARSGGRAAADRGLRRRRRPRARLALRARRRHRELGDRAAASSPGAARSTRGRSSASAIRDLTGGFKCYRRSVLETIDLDAIHSKGYAFQIETTYRDAPQGLPRRRGADPLRRPHRRPVEDEPDDLPRGRLEGARCCGFAALAGKV